MIIFWMISVVKYIQTYLSPRETHLIPFDSSNGQDDVSSHHLYTTGIPVVTNCSLLFVSRSSPSTAL